MVSSTQTGADILRPLAERGDERFSALRKPRMVWRHRGLGLMPFVSETEWMVDDSLGAIVRCAAACNAHVDYLGDKYTTDGVWVCILLVRPDQEDGDEAEYVEDGSTPEEAAARALVAAVEAL